MLWSVRNVDFWKTVPITLDILTGTAILLNSKTRRALAFANILILCSYTAFLGFRSISAYLDEASGTDQRVLSEYFFGTSLMPVLYHAVVVFQRRQFLTFVNTYPASLQGIWGLQIQNVNCNFFAIFLIC